MTNWIGAKCPNCGDEDHIDIQATAWLRLTENGTDHDASMNGDHEYTPKSLTVCATCGHSASLRDFGGEA